MQTDPHDSSKTQGSQNFTSYLPDEPVGLKLVVSEEDSVTHQRLLYSLQQVSKVLTAEVELTNILADMATIICNALGAKMVNFWKLTPDATGVYITAHYGMTQEYVEHSKKFPIKLGTAWIGRAVQTGRAWGTSDILKDIHLIREIPGWTEIVKKHAYRAVLCIPLISGKNTIGGLCAYYPETHKFTDFEMRLMSVAANQAATAITNAKIFGELVAERNKTVAMINSLDDGVIVYDLDNVIISINPRVEEILKIKKDELLYKKLGDFGNDAPTAVKNLKSVSTLALQDMESKEITLDEPERIYLRITSLPLKNENVQKIGSMRILEDITGEKQLEQLKSHFITVAAHQLRTPLGVIKWNLEMLLDGFHGELTGDLKETISKVNNTNKRMLTLVNDLLTASRIEEGYLTSQPQELNVKDVVASIVKELEIELSLKSIKVDLQVEDSLSYKVLVDPTNFRGAVQNLVSNAIKYNKVGGAITIKLSHKDKMYIISITDTGLGIPIKDQGKVFSKFFRAKNAVRNNTEGNGLGLFVVRSYVENWGGKVYFKSQEGVGSTFFVEIPETGTNKASPTKAPVQQASIHA